MGTSGYRRQAVSLALATGLAVASSESRAASEEASAVRIMPLGDSITEAYDGQASYRYFLWHKLAGRRYDVDFVGGERGVLDGEPRYRDFDQDHEGHCGWAAAEILFEIDAWLASARPDVVLVHLGTNDLAYGRSTETIIQDLGAIIDAVRAKNPRAAVLLAQIIPALGGEHAIRDLNGEIPVLAAGKTTVESPVIVVDQWTGFSTEEDLFDGLHPNERGERKMAERWLAALETVLPAPPPAPEAGGGYGPRRPDRAVVPTGQRRPDRVVVPTGPRRPDRVVVPTGPRRPGNAAAPSQLRRGSRFGCEGRALPASGTAALVCLVLAVASLRSRRT